MITIVFEFFFHFQLLTIGMYSNELSNSSDNNNNSDNETKNYIIIIKWIDD